MRLSLAEIDILIGLLGNVDWHAHFNDLITKQDQRHFAIAERALAKLEKRYETLEARGHKRAY